MFAGWEPKISTTLSGNHAFLWTTKDTELANSGHLYLCFVMQNRILSENRPWLTSRFHWKIPFSKARLVFFLSPKSETELVAPLKSTSVARRDNQKIVLAAVQQDTAFKNVCQNLVASHPVVSHIALHQYHASYWVYNPCVIQYPSNCVERLALQERSEQSLSFWGRLFVAFKPSTTHADPYSSLLKRKECALFFSIPLSSNDELFLRVLAGKCSAMGALDSSFLFVLLSLLTASQDWTALQFASPGARRNHAIALAAMGQVHQ